MSLCGERVGYGCESVNGPATAGPFGAGMNANVAGGRAPLSRHDRIQPGIVSGLNVDLQVVAHQWSAQAVQQSQIAPHLRLVRRIGHEGRWVWAVLARQKESGGVLGAE